MSQKKADRNLIEKSLQEEIQDSEWHFLRSHAERDAVIVVDPELSLLEVAVEVALDNQQKVQGWISKGYLAKPTVQSLQIWNQNPTLKFRFVIVQPFVLVQQQLVH